MGRSLPVTTGRNRTEADVWSREKNLSLSINDSPYVKAGSKAGYKGYNYQNKRWATQARPSKGSAWEILGACQ